MSTPSTSNDHSGSDTRIAVGIDGSEGGERALDWAAAEAARTGASLEVHTAYEPGYEFATPEDIRRSMEHTVEAAKKRVSEIAPQVIVTTCIHEQSAAAALIEASHGVQHLVVGTRGLGGFKGLLLGSVSHQCVSHALCPVTVVR